uniref:FERM domain-containing protein n=1 Tax=Echinostoma caproni TaxID=27848 RepID=A0A183AEG2_9TREM
LTKEEADYRLLDAARKVELYGVRLHPIKDVADQPFNLAVTHAGVLVFQRFSRVNTYIWSKIRKLSFNRHKFLIKLHTGDQVCVWLGVVSRTSDGPISSGQVSQLSTPVRRLARIRQHAASFKLFGRPQKRTLEELQSPCLVSDTKPAWALPEHPYNVPRQTSASIKPVGLTKLLSNCPNPTAEHFQLLRLSFTSLIPESSSALDTGHTTPTAGSRMRTLERMRERAVSTPSIHQSDVPRRKRSCHAFVPRQFDPLGSNTLPGARLKSQISDGILDLSASRTFPRRPDLDEAGGKRLQKENVEVNHGPDGTSTPSPTTSTKVYRVNGYSLPRTPSSSCSLASDMSPTPLSENETTLNDLGGLTSPRDPRESWLDPGGENEDSWSLSSREPAPSKLVSPVCLKNCCLGVSTTSLVGYDAIGSLFRHNRY